VQTADIDLGQPSHRPPRPDRPRQDEASTHAEPPTRPAEPERPQEVPPPKATEPAGGGAAGGQASGAGAGSATGGGAGGGGDRPLTAPSGRGDAESSTVAHGTAGDGSAADDAPTPAFPGRPANRPTMTAAEAETSAKRMLNLARSAVRRGDADEACRQALAAYETAAAHAGTHDGCGDVARDAERLLAAVGRRQRVLDVPTRFE
jgi:hypothetical protein